MYDTHHLGQEFEILNVKKTGLTDSQQKFILVVKLRGFYKVESISLLRNQSIVIKYRYKINNI